MTNEAQSEHPGRRLAWAAMDEILAHPQLHDQLIWLEKTKCGTVACLAGRVTLLAGDTPSRWTWPSSGGNMKTDIVISSATGRRRLVRARAQGLLHINDFQAGALFSGGNSIDDLINTVTEIFGPRPEAQDGQAS